MDRQAVATKVYQFLLKQGKPAIGADGGCLYQAPDGCRCAIGCLLPDDHPLLSSRPSKTIGTVLGLDPFLKKVLGAKSWPDQYFLTDLQGAHDSAAGDMLAVEGEVWDQVLQQRFRKLTNTWGLEMPCSGS